MARIAIIDDEEAIRYGIRLQLDAQDVVEFESPMDLYKYPEPELLTHAIIDLSYGPARSGCSPPRPNALNAMLALDASAPNCKRIVMSVLSGPRFRELARAVEQFWPGTVMLAKTRFDAFTDDLRRFASNDRSLMSHVELVEAIEGVTPWDRWRNPPAGVVSMMSTVDNGDPYALVRTFARFDHQPSRGELIEHFDFSDQATEKVMKAGSLGNKLSEFRGTIDYWLADKELSGAGLWAWCEPRWPIFEAIDPRGRWTSRSHECRHVTTIT